MIVIEVITIQWYFDPLEIYGGSSVHFRYSEFFFVFQCHGPKFKRNDCCEGFICVALYKPGAEDVLECVDEDEHFRVQSISEILREVDRELGKSVPYKQNYNQPLLLDDKSLASFMNEMRDLEREDGSFNMRDFNNPILLENPSYKNVTIQFHEA